MRSLIVLALALGLGMLQLGCSDNAGTGAPADPVSGTDAGATPDAAPRVDAGSTATDGGPLRTTAELQRNGSIKLVRSR
jgi:hypothetical protein